MNMRIGADGITPPRLGKGNYHMTKKLIARIAADQGKDPADLLPEYLAGKTANPFEAPVGAYASFEMTHVDDDPRENDDAVVKYYIDGYPAGEDLPGSVIAVVTMTRRGDIVIDWHHNGYRLNEAVLELVAQAKAEMLEEKREE